MGNRVKGRVKKKSMKMASHSSMGSKRKLSRMGKKQKKDHSGLDATFIGRAACIKRLQVSLKDFRRLCILKGVYPREPRGRAPSNKKRQVFYHIKDVRALAHEPLLQKFRDFKSFMKKVRRASGRNEQDEASRKDSLAPVYTVHHLVKERYPRFLDALGDLDDALSLIFLFAALPSQGRIKTKVTNKAKSLAASWSAYCSTTSSMTKCFVSIKGVYLEALVQNSKICWVVPHSFTQNIPRDVDFRVMLTFFEFYENLLGFVLYKLYNDIGVRFPLPVTDFDAGASSTLHSHLHVLNGVLRDAKGSASTAVAEAVGTASSKDGDRGISGVGEKHANTKNNKSQSLLKSVGTVLNKVEDDDSSDDCANVDDMETEEISSPLGAVLKQMSHEQATTIGIGTDNLALDEDASKRKCLFTGLTFFFSREVPKGYLELVSLSYGAKVGWEGVDSPISIKDPSVTHFIIDRPKLSSSFENIVQSSEFIQPQWILDCANFHVLLPCSKYAVGAELPPHLSPWVDDEEEGYKPAYAEEIECIKNGGSFVDNNPRKEESISKVEEKVTLNQDLEVGKDEVMSDSDTEVEEEDDSSEEDEEKALNKVEQQRLREDEEAKKLAKGMMSKKAARLYGRMQHGRQEKQKKVDELNRKRKDIELVEGTGKTAAGETMLKAKVTRLKGERRSIEKDYEKTEGSMKKKKRKKIV